MTSHLLPEYISQPLRRAASLAHQIRVTNPLGWHRSSAYQECVASIDDITELARLRCPHRHLREA